MRHALGFFGRLAAAAGLGWLSGFLWFALTLPRPAPDGLRTDAIVVLTGDRGRLARGVALMRRGGARRMLVSGVAPSVRPHELAVEARAPRALFSCCVDLGRAAVDTRSNAEETMAWVAANRVASLRLITSDYHMRRALVELGAELPPGVRVVADAVPGEASPGRLAREYSKWLWRSIARQATAPR